VGWGPPRVEGNVVNKALPLLQGTREIPLPLLMPTNCGVMVIVGWVGGWVVVVGGLGWGGIGPGLKVV
jgi:hypothetical protein